MTLRPYQQAAFDAIVRNIGENVYAALPTGAGKSHIIAELCKWATSFDGTRVIVLAHVKELLEQNGLKIAALMPQADIAYYCAGLGEKRIGEITLASVQSLANIADQLPPVDLFIADEAHRIPHANIGQYRALFNAQPDARIVGLTATPYRVGGGYLHEGKDAIFAKCAYNCRTDKLIHAGYLSDMISRQGGKVADTNGLHTRSGEFILSEMSEAFDTADINHAMMKDIMTQACDRQSIMIFCCTVRHCWSIYDCIKSHGEKSVEVITGATKPEQRADAIERFRNKSLRIIINCDVLTTGFDAPNVDCIVLLRATKSPGLYVQIIGRGLRKSEGKDNCLLLDYGGNVMRHGTIDGLVVDAKTERAKKILEPKACPECQTFVNRFCKICENCGHQWETEQRKIELSDCADKKNPIWAEIVKRKVGGVSYRKHSKPNKPHSLRVDYSIGICDTISEWICLEHSGFARQKAAEWFARRGEVAPKTVDEALSISEKLLCPKAIMTKREGKYKRIVGYEF